MIIPFLTVFLFVMFLHFIGLWAFPATIAFYFGSAVAVGAYQGTRDGIRYRRELRKYRPYDHERNGL